MKKDQIKKLIELANTLDEKGMESIANKIDKIVEGQEYSPEWEAEQEKAKMLSPTIEDMLRKANRLLEAILQGAPDQGEFGFVSRSEIENFIDNLRDFV